MIIEISNQYDDIMVSGEYTNMQEAVSQNRLILQGANLRSADLRSAD